MSGVNRFFQRKRFAEFQPLSMQEMAFPFEKQEARTRENMAMAAKLSEMGLNIDNLAVDNPYAEELLNKFKPVRDEAVNYMLSPNANWREGAKKFMNVSNLKNEIENTGGKYLGQRKALQLAQLERLKNAQNLSEKDRNYIQSQINNIFTESYSGEGNPLEGAKNVNWTDSYDFAETTKQITDRVKALKPSALDTGTITKLGNANDYTEVFKILQGKGLSPNTILQAMSPWVSSTINDKGELEFVNLQDDLTKSILQGYAANGNSIYDEDGNITTDAKNYLKEETNRLLDTGLAQAFSEFDVNFKFLEDAGAVKKLETPETLVQAMRTIGANIDNENFFDFYNTIGEGDKKIQQLTAEAEQLKDVDPRLYQEKIQERDELSAELAYWKQNEDDITRKLQENSDLQFITRYNSFNVKDATTVEQLEQDALNKVVELGLEELPFNDDNTSSGGFASNQSLYRAKNIEFARSYEQYIKSGVSPNKAKDFAIRDVNSMHNNNVDVSRPVEAGNEGAATYWMNYQSKLQSNLISQKENLNDFINDNRKLFAKETTVVTAIGEGKSFTRDYNNSLTDLSMSNPEAFTVKGTSQTLDDYINNLEGTIKIDGIEYELTGKRINQITTSSNTARVGLEGKDKNGNTRIVKSVLVKPDEDNTLTQRQETLADELIKSTDAENRKVGYEIKANLEFDDKYNHANLLNAKYNPDTGKGDTVETTIKLDGAKVSFEKAQGNAYKLRLNGKPVSIKPVTDDNGEVIDYTVVPYTPGLTSLLTYNELNTTLLALKDEKIPDSLK